MDKDTDDKDQVSLGSMFGSTVGTSEAAQLFPFSTENSVRPDDLQRGANTQRTCRQPALWAEA